MNKKLVLSQVIRLKKQLENHISQTRKNSFEYINGSLEEYEDQLIVIKEAIQSINRDKHRDKKSNNYYIYKLSNLNAERIYLDKLNNQEDGLVEQQELVAKEISNINHKLENFNETKKLRVKLDPNLNPQFEEWGIVI